MVSSPQINVHHRQPTTAYCSQQSLNTTPRTQHTNQAGHSPVIIKVPDFSRTFPDISSEYLRSIDPRNSSDTKPNACYFSLQYSYILSQLWQLCSSVDSNNIRGNIQEHILPDFSLTTLEFPDFSGFSRWVATLSNTRTHTPTIHNYLRHYSWHLLFLQLQNRTKTS